MNNQWPTTERVFQPGCLLLALRFGPNYVGFVQVSVSYFVANILSFSPSIKFDKNFIHIHCTQTLR